MSASGGYDRFPPPPRRCEVLGDVVVLSFLYRCGGVFLLLHRPYDLTSSGSCDPLCLVDETISPEYEATYKPKTELLKGLPAFGAVVNGTVAINHFWVATNQMHGWLASNTQSTRSLK
ncbi:hypothetical protein R6Q59_015008 [Mikania micrantha]